MTRNLQLAPLSSLCATAVQGQMPASVEQLGRLAGCRAAVGGEAGSGEQGMPRAGGTMLGVGR
jgi:hypothetical protein